VGFKFFVYYDDDGNITAITNEKRPSGNFLETDESEILDFLNGSKDFTKFKITSLSSGTKQIKLATESTSLIYKDFYIVGKANDTEQVLIFHDVFNSCWNISLDSQAKQVDFSLYICKKENLNFLIREIKVPARKNVLIPFDLDIEKNISNLMILVKKIHQSYGIKYV
jgi:hypothetical protein